MSLLSTACQTNKHNNSNFSKDLLKSEGAQDSMPPSLWSPARRKANAGYYFLVAEQESLKSNHSDAMNLYEMSYNLDSNAFLAWKMIAAYANAGELNTALLQAKKMVLLYPKDADIHTLYAHLLSRHGMNEDAILHYERAIEINKEKIDAYVGLIQLHKSQNSLHESVVIANELVRSNPSYIDGWAILAKLHLSLKQSKLALRPAKRAYDLQSSDPEKVLIYALALELNGQSQKAVNLYEILFRLNPTNDELISRMVGLYKQIGDLEDALELLNEVEGHQKEPGVGVSLQKVFILWEMKRFNDSLNIVSKLATKYPESERIRYIFALSKEKTGDLPGSLGIYQKIKPESQYYLHSVYRSILIHKNLKDYAAAMELVGVALGSTDPAAVDFYPVGANILSKQGKNIEAGDLLKRGVEKHPERLSFLFLSGVYYEKANEYDLCVAVMKRLIKQNPKHSGALNFLGYLYADRGENLEEAEKLILRALKIKENDGYYKDSLGWVYYKQKKYQKALKLVEEANALAPGEGVILEHLGDIHMALGNTEKAKKYYTEAVGAKLEDRDRKRIEEKYEKFRNRT